MSASDLKALARGIRATMRAESLITALVAQRSYVLPYTEGFHPNYVTPFFGVFYEGPASNIAWQKGEGPPPYIEETAWSFWAFQKHLTNDWEAAIIGSDDGAYKGVLEMVDVVRTTMIINKLTSGGYAGNAIIDVRPAQPPRSTGFTVPANVGPGNVYFAGAHAVTLIYQRKVG